MTVSLVHRFAGTDPLEHLAREELWFDDIKVPALLLYVNAPCVVIGKHQNPFREVRLEELARRSVPLFRRTSGGGTVWHDEGNLNWSFLLPKSGYDRVEVTRSVASALGTLGLSLEAGDKGDLFLAGKKVSGAAYLHRRDRVLHHGTLLCRSRLADLHGVLGPTGTLLEWIGVASRPMPVTNLEVDIDRAVDAFLGAFAASGTEIGNGTGDPEFERRVAERSQRQGSASWVWDQTPPFTWEGPTRHGSLRAQVRDGQIVEAWDDRSLNMSNMVGKRFFDPDLFEYIPTREVP